MMGSVFDPTISLGAIINALALLIGFVIAFTRIGGRIDLLVQRMVSVETILTKHSDIGNRLIRLEEQVSTAQRDLADLRRGEGWITNRVRKTVDGEYP